MKIAIIGAGSWGTALAKKACEAHNDTYLYCRNAMRAAEIMATRENKAYLPGVCLPETLRVSADMVEVIEGASIILLVTPSAYVRETLLVIEPLIKKEMIIVSCSKGLDRSSGMRISELMVDCLGHITSNLVILSGPNHAEEIGRDLPAATVVASRNIAASKTVQKALNSAAFRVYINEDMTGVELGGTTKNIIALAAGIADGMQLGDNLKATLLTRGLHEMTKFGVYFGARRETYAGLAGMGDLIATCMSPHSRNRKAGQKLADGETMDYIMNHTNMVVEGFYAVPLVYEIAKRNGIEMPITFALYDVLIHNKPVKDVITDLMMRSPKDEMFI